MEKLMRTADYIPQAKVARTLFRQSKVRPQAVRANHLAGGSGISPEKPCTAGARTFIRLWNEIPGSAS